MKNVSSKITLVLLFAVALLFSGCVTTPLTNAARKGDTKETERLIAAGADVNAKDRTGLTPLFVAAGMGKKEVVELLISKGADVNAKGPHGLTPLHSAAYFGKKEVVESLISGGADVNAKDSKGKTPLDYAKERSLTSIVSLLIAEPRNPAEEAAFTETARNYRAATVKPTLPDEARKFKVQAEYAVNKSDFEGAVARYKEALDVAPWWPEGHFDRAMILGKLSRYRDATREMERYLILVPDASNARDAQDKIYQWEVELK